MECIIAAMGDEPTGPLDRLVVGSVAITARAIAAAGAELTFVQWRALLVVGETGHGVTVGEIAARIAANQSPTSRLVSRLKRRGLLQSTKADPDGRMTRVTLTEAGGELRRRVLAHRRDRLAVILETAGLSAQEAAAV